MARSTRILTCKPFLIMQNKHAYGKTNWQVCHLWPETSGSTETIAPSFGYNVGGYNVVFMGDFDQLPPVTGSALYKDLLRFENIKDTPTKSKMTNTLSPDHPRYQGLHAFSQLSDVNNKQNIKRQSCTCGLA